MVQTRGRRRRSAEFKAEVALEAIHGERSNVEIARSYGIHPVQVSQWKKQALDELPQVFAVLRANATPNEAELNARLYQEIVQLKMELDRLKGKVRGAVEEKRALVDPDHGHLSLTRQCELLGLARSSWYYQPRTVSGEPDLIG